MTKKDSEVNFEKAFARLEEILETLNSGNVSLDESLKLYEEADKLIATCGNKLTDAERKVEKLIKQRNGELQVGADQQPMTENFSPNQHS